jgi:hypothetical protein
VAYGDGRHRAQHDDWGIVRVWIGRFSTPDFIITSM